MTTTALGLAAVLPVSARPVVVECDPAGGDLAVRHGLSVVPGVVEVAAAVHRPPRTATDRRLAGPAEGQDGGSVEGAVLSRYTQRLRLAGQVVEVLLSPPGGVQAAMAVAVLAQAEQQVLDPPDRVVVADCGRLDAGSAAWPVLRAATVTVLVLGSDVEDVAHVRARLPELREAVSDRLAVIAVAGRYGAGEIGAALAPVWPAGVREVLPVDRRAAAVLSGGLRGAGRWRRSRLASALTRLAAGLPPHAPLPPDGPKAELAAGLPEPAPAAGVAGERHG